MFMKERASYTPEEKLEIIKAIFSKKAKIQDVAKKKGIAPTLISLWKKQAEDAKAVLDFVKETLGDKVFAVRISKVLKSAPVCMTADGPMTLEMEKYFSKLEGANQGMKAQRVLELNAASAPYSALKSALDSGDTDKAAKYAEILYTQSLLIAGLPIDDPAAYTELVCSLMN